MRLPRAEGKWTREEAAHLLNRAGFGGTPEEIDRLHAMGRERAVENLLSGEAGHPAWENPSDESSGNVREMVRELRRSRQDLSEEELDKERRKLVQMAQRNQRKAGRNLTSWWFGRMVNTRSPLREKMVLFWHDHFATGVRKVRNVEFMHQQNELFRKNAWGNFRELTQAIVRDPAMVIYLDVANSRKDQPNENFAREVLELFTLGEGNYTEKDIKEAARAFTGYQLNRRTGSVIHQKRQWDEGEKTVLGESGAFTGEDVVEVIFRQDAASTYLPWKLWEFFVYENPSEKGVAALGEIFAEAEFEVKPLLREIFLSREFYSEKARRTQIKSPVQFLVGLCRQLELEGLPEAYLINAQQQLGQVLFEPPNVAGWDWGQAWINTNTLLTRYNIAGVVTKGVGADTLAAQRGPEGNMNRIKGVLKFVERNWQGPDYEKIAPREMRGDSGSLVDALAFRLFQAPLSESQRTKFVEFADAQRGVIFTNTEVAELIHLMMSQPQYQLT